MPAEPTLSRPLGTACLHIGHHPWTFAGVQDVADPLDQKGLCAVVARRQTLSQKNQCLKKIAGRVFNH